MPSLHSGLMVGAPGSITAFLIGFITPCMLYATYRTYIANSAVCEERMKAGRQGRTSGRLGVSELTEVLGVGDCRSAGWPARVSTVEYRAKPGWWFASLSLLSGTR